MSEVITTAPESPDAFAALSARLDAAETRSTRAETRYLRGERRFRVLCGTLFAALMITVSVPFVFPTAAQGFAMTLQQLTNEVVALKAKTASMTAISDLNTGQPTVRFTGVNVQIVSGSGATEGTINGRGNLIVGYNEVRNQTDSLATVRAGSHNLVVGARNYYQNFGGVVVGEANTISGDYASIVGGHLNVANGFISSVFGGEANTASNYEATAIGGIENTASGNAALVIGGRFNVASGVRSLVGGGVLNEPTATESTVIGGNGNRAIGLQSSAIGGRENVAQGNNSTVSGGFRRTIPNEFGY